MQVRGFDAAILAVIAGTMGPACSSSPNSVDKAESSGLITDQTHGGGTPGTYWLPPIVTETAPFSAIDATALTANPAVSLRIDFVPQSGNPVNRATSRRRATRPSFCERQPMPSIFRRRRRRFTA